MTAPSPPIGVIRVAPHRHVAANARTLPSHAPEWPRLTQREVRQIVLDILG